MDPGQPGSHYGNARQLSPRRGLRALQGPSFDIFAQNEVDTQGPGQDLRHPDAGTAHSERPARPWGDGDGGCRIEFSEGGRGRSAERRAFRPGSPWVGTLQLPTTCAGGYSLPCLAISRIPFCFLCYSGAWLFVNRLSPCSNYHRRWLSNVETPNTPSAAKVAPRSDRQSLAGRRSAMRQRASRCTARQCDSEPASQPVEHSHRVELVNQDALALVLSYLHPTS